MRASSFVIYGAVADNGNALVWPRGARVVSIGDYDALQAELWKYGKHLTACRRTTVPDSWCTCGWDKVRETLAPRVEHEC